MLHIGPIKMLGQHIQMPSCSATAQGAVEISTADDGPAVRETPGRAAHEQVAATGFAKLHGQNGRGRGSGKGENSKAGFRLLGLTEVKIC